MTVPWRIGGGVVAAFLAVVVAGLSQLPVGTGDPMAYLRLSWRIEPLRVEECRTLTEEEQATVPAHMRRAEECVGYFVDYELVLSVDGAVAHVDTIPPSGLRRDRPVYVLQDVPVEPGHHEFDVRFAALVPETFEGDTALVHRSWSGPMTLDAGQVGLITVDAAGRRLLRGGTPP